MPSNDQAGRARAIAVFAAVALLCACSNANDSAADAGALAGHSGGKKDAGAGGTAADSGNGEGDSSTASHDGALGDGAAGTAANRTDGGFVDLDAAAGQDASDSDADRPALEELPYIQHVVSFTPGDHAGYGQTKYPDVIYGPPKGNGVAVGSLDVLSLGVGGTIVVDFGPRDIVDGSGPDFVVFENAFWPSGDSTMVFAEPAEVSVSADGSTWKTFPCDSSGDGSGHYVGCAGWSPALEYDPYTTLPLDHAVTGGDAFDLDDVGLAKARYVKIHDLATSGASNSGGFDLDAAGLIHYELRP